MINDSLLDEAYTEKAVREEQAERDPRRQNLVDLAGPKVPAANTDRRGRYRPNQAVDDLIGTGHSVSVVRFSNPDVPEYCKFCGDRLLSPAEWSACEFADVSKYEKCRCNGCVVRRDGVRKRGGQPRQCGAAKCVAALRKDQQTRKRKRDNQRDQLQAVEIIRLNPARSDKDIATELGIRPVRVKEARRIVA